MDDLTGRNTPQPVEPEEQEKKKAEVVDEVERDGRIILVYDNGMERDKESGHLLHGPKHSLLTPEKATLYHRRRQEKAAALLRKRIVEETKEVSKVKLNGSASAIAYVGGVLWKEIVLSKKAYPRDRMEAFEKLGKFAEVLPDARSKDVDPNAVLNAYAAGANKQAAEIQERIWRDMMQTRGDAIDGEIKE